MQLDAEKAFNALPVDQRRKIIEVSRCSSDDITRKFHSISIEEAEEILEAMEVDFPCSVEDQGNLLPGLDDEPQFPKCKSIFLVTQRGVTSKNLENSFVLPVISA